MKPITWTVNREGTHLAMMGPITVAHVWYTCFRSKDDPLHYQLTFKLPGFLLSPRYKTVDEAKSAAEKAINQWFKEVL